MHVAAVIVAAGSGIRFGGDAPKQFIELNGKPMYMWSTEVLLQHTGIKRIVIVSAPDMVQALQSTVDAKLQSRGQKPIGAGSAATPIKVVAGGATRQESVYKGLSALAADAPAPTHVLVHDAARPFLTSEIIDRVIDTLKTADACTVAIPASDTVKRVVDGRIVETLNREELHLMQTPQAARFDLLYRAHEAARSRNVATTDDAAILEADGVAVRVVLGSRFNIKVTEKEDLLLSLAIATIIGGSHM